MLFNSPTFFVFFLLLLFLYYQPFLWRDRKVLLLVSSYIFYSAWNPPFVVLLLISTLIDWTAAKRMQHCTLLSRRRLWMMLSVFVNLGILGYFKYGNFLLENFVMLMNSLGLSFQAPALDVVLPVGISFYTFQTLSYSLDVYRKNEVPDKSFLDFALYVSFFPQLVAGPIVRHSDFKPQCIIKKKRDYTLLGQGVFLLLIGLFEKVVLADLFLAPIADQVFDHASAATGLDSWVGIFAFSGQIFFDFSGYSLCAIGTALCLGFRLPTNFKLPYGAIGFSDFWRRWHISLSTWLRDYLYIPLGGNRHGLKRLLFSLFVTMFLGGLWHGASWNFVFWGMLHGLYLILERLLNPFFLKLPKALWSFFTFVVVSLTWVFFRSSSFQDSGKLLGASFGLNETASKPLLGDFDYFLVFLLMGAVFVLQYKWRTFNLYEFVNRGHWLVRGLVMALLALAIVLFRGKDNAFIYFQF